MSDEADRRPALDAPSEAEFEAAKEELAGRGPSLFVRVLRAIAALIVIAALLFYFVEPFRSVLTVIPLPWRSPDSGARPIPLAPTPKTSPRQSS